MSSPITRMDGCLQIPERSRQDELYWNVTGNFWDFPIQEGVGHDSPSAMQYSRDRQSGTVNGWTGDAKGKTRWQEWKLVSKDGGSDQSRSDDRIVTALRRA